MADAASPPPPNTAKRKTPRSGYTSKESEVIVSPINQSANASITPVSIKSRDATIERALAALAGS